MKYSTFPYHNIVGDLVASTMRAQAILVSAHLKRAAISSLHGQINKQFAWLALEFPIGKNRHFFDAPEPPLNPLRVGGLRNDKNLDKDVKRVVIRRLKLRRAPDDDTDGVKLDPEEVAKYWQQNPTRISSLVMVAFEEDMRSQGKGHLSIRSPLAIVYDFLAAPDTAGSTAYSLLALRNYLFSELKTVPRIYAADPGFCVQDVESELSSIRTSLRYRYESRGADKLPVGSRSGAVVRHFLAMKGVLRLFFSSVSKCESYLRDGQFIKSVTTNDPYPFEFEKSPRLEKLPEVGEIVNELFGLPLPIRGADTVFRGGLKFSSHGGLVMAVHGGPGCGKTSLALSFGAYLAPFGIRTLFISGEEEPDDLHARLHSLVPEGIRRLDFFDQSLKDAFTFCKTRRRDESLLKDINTALAELKETKLVDNSKLHDKESFYIRKPCRAIVVLDGLHDFLADKTKEPGSDPCVSKQLDDLYSLIESAKDSGALVILTSGDNWTNHTMLDYLVDVAIQLTYVSMDQYGAKPDRRFRLMKTRHQLCAAGTHGFQITGSKGMRLSPQINYQLDRRSIWKVAVPNEAMFKTVLQRVTDYEGFWARHKKSKAKLSRLMAKESVHAPRIFSDSHVFINGQGSGGKAALALKIALAPSFTVKNRSVIRSNKTEKVLVVSFLYPKEYYEDIFDRLKKVIDQEYSDTAISEKKWQTNPRMEVIHFYPGHLRPNDLYNRIELELTSAELYGDPYTSVIIDGIHNVFLQFPEIEAYRLLWPQIYNSLRSRAMMIITTHTTLSVPRAFQGEIGVAPLPPVDDNRSEPLRHALVQKSDFQFEVDPVPPNKSPYKDHEGLSSLFAVRTMSAIGQPIPNGHVLWSREAFVFVEDPALSVQNELSPRPLGKL